MREDETLSGQFVSVLLERAVIEVIWDSLLKSIRLTDEQVCRPCKLGECIGPLRVAGVVDHFPGCLNPKAERVCPWGVRDLEARNAKRSERLRLSRAQLVEADLELLSRFGGARKQKFGG